MLFFLVQIIPNRQFLKFLYLRLEKPQTEEQKHSVPPLPSSPVVAVYPKFPLKHFQCVTRIYPGQENRRHVKKQPPVLNSTVEDRWKLINEVFLNSNRCQRWHNLAAVVYPP